MCLWCVGGSGRRHTPSIAVEDGVEIWMETSRLWWCRAIIHSTSSHTCSSSTSRTRQTSSVAGRNQEIMPAIPDPAVVRIARRILRAASPCPMASPGWLRRLGRPEVRTMTHTWSRVGRPVLGCCWFGEPRSLAEDLRRWTYRLPARKFISSVMIEFMLPTMYWLSGQVTRRYSKVRVVLKVSQ